MGASKTFWKNLNDAWPKDLPIPTDKEAINGVKRLYRHVVGKPLPLKVVVVRHKRRRTWSRRGRFVVSPEYPYPRSGWPAIVHDLSHYVHRRMRGWTKPHDSRQARIEKAMQDYVLERLTK